MYLLTYSHQKRTPWHKGDEVESRRLEREAQRNVVLMWLTGRLVPEVDYRLYSQW